MTGRSRWDTEAARLDATGYAAHFERLAAAGQDMHGEAAFCARLTGPPARVLDAGCGTGRVAARLYELGYDCVGVDQDPDMLAIARRVTGPTWRLGDLAALTAIPGLGGSFEIVLAAGNVIPLVEPGTEATVIAQLAARTSPGGFLVAGFGLDAAHLPLAQPPFGLPDYDSWCSAAGLSRRARYATWDGAPYDGGGYAVSVHVRA
jgi:SAM-dependent methyltransferase